MNRAMVDVDVAYAKVNWSKPPLPQEGRLAPLTGVCVGLIAGLALWLVVIGLASVVWRVLS